MVEKQNKMTIGFSFENEFGDKFSATTTVGQYDTYTISEIDLIGKQLNVFLRQCGYARERDLIFMEDVSEEEWEALADCLEELRLSKERAATNYD